MMYSLSLLSLFLSLPLGQSSVAARASLLLCKHNKNIHVLGLRDILSPLPRMLFFLPRWSFVWFPCSLEAAFSLKRAPRPSLLRAPKISASQAGSSYSPSLLYFPQSTSHYQPYHTFYIFTLFISPLKRKLHEGKDFCLLCSLCYPQSLENRTWDTTNFQETYCSMHRHHSICTVFQYYTQYRRRQWHPTPVLLPGESHGRRSLAGYSPWGRKESGTTEGLHFHFTVSCTGEGNGNPLQCSCLENPRDGGAWLAAISGVAQSWTRLKRLSNNSSQ